MSDTLAIKYIIKTLKNARELVSAGHTKYVIHKVAPYCIDRWMAEDALEPFLAGENNKLQRLLGYDFAILQQQDELEASYD